MAALNESRQLATRVDEVSILNELANVYRDSGRIVAAQDYAQRSLKLAED